MPNYINKVKLPNNDVYDIQDANALPKTTTINGVSKAQDANTYTLTGDDIILSSSYVVPQTYTPPVAGVTSIEDSIANLVKHVDDAVSGSVTSVDEGENSHLDITTATGGAVTVNVATGYVIPPDTVQASASGGSTLTLVSTGDKYTWDHKLDGVQAYDSTEEEYVTVTNTKLVAGSNKVTITPDATNNTITIDSTGTTYTEGTGIDIATGDVINNTGVLDVASDNTTQTAANGTVTITKLNSAGTATEEVPVAVKGLAASAYKGVDTAITSTSTSANIPTSDVVYGFVNTNYASKAVFTTSADGLVPASDGTDEDTMFLKGDGTWATPTDTTYTEGTGIDIDSSNVISNTGVTAVTASDASTGTNGTILVSTAGATPVEVPVKGLQPAAYKDVDTSITTSTQSANLPTSAAVDTYVQNAIAGITGPMIFKGAATIGADGSITVPGTVTTIKQGFTFKVTEVNASYSGVVKVGDTLIADTDDPTTTGSWVEGTDWTLIPSGDEEGATYPKFEFITDYVYTRVATATTWTADTYYSRSGDTYTLTSSEPADWDTNYNSYYTKSATAGSFIGIAYSTT